MLLMKKKDAIKALGGTDASAARAIGITRQAIGQWPDVLTPKLSDRVEAAIARLANLKLPRRRVSKHATEQQSH